ncbi:tRNA (guanine(9)-N(1))-methyltransferase [Lecanora helva]
MESATQQADSRDSENPPLSKNKLKKLKRDQQWEASRAKRKAKRKEKMQEKKQRKRAAREEANPSISTQSNPVTNRTKGVDGSSNKLRRPRYTQLPITIVLDCGFDDLMMDKERTSLGSQITRCYSDNHKAPYQTHLAISSFSGHLKERFDGLLAGHYHSWRNVRFLENDFVEAASQAKQWMKGDQGGKLAGAFAESSRPEQEAGHEACDGEVIYLSSDSPNTLTELRPYSTYIIGGLVDRNRHKGVCYKKAMDRSIKTAKLPIGDYMQMTSRFVLATNHVAEIMLRWLEFGDWGKAFLQVVPKRKGGVLKGDSESANNVIDDNKVEDEDGEVNGNPSEEDANERSSTTNHHSGSETGEADLFESKMERKQLCPKSWGENDSGRVNPDSL